MLSPDIAFYPSAKLLPRQVKGLVENCFNDPNWLRVFEEFSGIDIEPCHHLMTSNNIPIGFLPGYIEKESLCGTLRDRLFGSFSKSQIFKRWGTNNALVCSSPWGFYSGIECFSKDKTVIYKALINRFDQIANNRKLDISGFTYVPESSKELRRQLEINGYKPFTIGPTTFLKMKWNSFDEYVADLPSRSARSVIRRERKKAKQMSFEWFKRNSLETSFYDRPLSSILMELHNNIQCKYFGIKSRLDKNFLSKLWEVDRDNLRLCLAKLERRIVAFALLRVFGRTAHIFMVGRDYNLPDDLQSYFNVMYYEPIIRGIKEGWRFIYFRPGVYQSKLRRGCQLESLYLYIKGHNILAQTFLDLYIPITRKYFREKFSPPEVLNH